MVVSAYFEASAAKGINGNQADTSIPQAGAVYIFTRTGGQWSQQAYIKASNTGEAGEGDNFGDGDQFGFSVAISDDGNTVAVGANAEDSNATGINGNQADNSMVSAGAVYVFTRTGAAWTQQAYVKPSNTFGGTQFGYAVSLNADGNIMAITQLRRRRHLAHGQRAQMRGRNGSGAVYVFYRNAGKWTQDATSRPKTPSRTTRWACRWPSVDDGNTIVSGSLDEDCLATGVNPTDPTCEHDVMSDTSAGAVYVFARRAGEWKQQAYYQGVEHGPNDTFGSRLALSGDGNTSRPLRSSKTATPRASTATRRTMRAQRRAPSTSSPARAPPGASSPTSRPRTTRNSTSSAARSR
jgi:hypothetical protein